jgi:hypothetical protein
MAIDGDETDSEMRGIRPLQLGDIVSDSTGILRPEFFVAAGQESLQWGFRGVTAISRQGIGTNRTDYLGIHYRFLIRSKRSNPHAIEAAQSR